MKALIITAIITVVIATQAIVSPAQSDLGGAHQTTFECSGPFEAKIHYGPNTGLSLDGVLTLQVKRPGSVKGVLMRHDGTEVKVVGQAKGRAINLLFELGGNDYIFGVGTSQKNVSECTGVAGGPLAGPAPGDLGDWGYALGG